MSEWIIGGCCDTRPHLPSRRLIVLLLPPAAAAAGSTFAKRDKSQSISSSLSAWPCPSKPGQSGEGGRPEFSQSPPWAGQSMREPTLPSGARAFLGTKPHLLTCLTTTALLSLSSSLSLSCRHRSISESHGLLISLSSTVATIHA